MKKLALATLLMVAPTAIAADAPENVVEYRETVMEGLSKHMKAASMIAKSEVSRPGDVAMHAEGVLAYAKLIKELFPEGTGPDKVKSESQPAVWTERAKFDKAADDLVAKAEAWVKAAKGGDMAQTMGAMGAVGKACGTCHDDFKVDEDH
jgi:cytochrome c556